MRGNQVLFHGKPAFFILGRVNADAICTVLSETVELRLGSERNVQVFGLTDVDFFMAGAAVVVVLMHALGHEIDCRHGFEPRFQRPYLEVVFLPRFSAESDASVFHGRPRSR